VSADPDTDILTFGVNHGEPEVAARLATAYAEAFTAYKLATDTASLVRARREIQGRLSELRSSGATGTDTYRELLGQWQDLRTLEVVIAPATVIRTAGGAGQIAPTPRRNATLGVLLGLMLGVGGAFVLNAFDRRVRHADDVEHELQIPLLAKLPTPRRNDSTTILERPPDEITEAIARLRTSFDFANADLGAKVVMVTSAGAPEGKTTTIANLGVALSRTGRHVVIVDLDLRRPALERLFHLPDRTGATDVASGNSDLVTALNRINTVPRRARVTTLRESDTNLGVLEVLTAGRTNVDPGNFVETVGLTDLLRQLRDRADIVLVDAPPILATGDAMALTAKVDAILMINRLGKLTRPTHRELARVLDRSPAPVLGFVATGSDADEGYPAYREEGPRWTAGPARAEEPDVPEEVRAAAGSGRWAPRK
jgi:succinoglycan biosynthesis transport protein ExoP